MDKTELSGVVNSISKSSTDNGISIKTECTRKNSPGIENKIPEEKENFENDDVDPKSVMAATNDESEEE